MRRLWRRDRQTRVQNRLGRLPSGSASEIGERIRDAKRHQRRSGQYLGGDRPFGWGIGEDGTLIKKEDEQRALAGMQALRSQGHELSGHLRAISEHMRTEFDISLSHRGVKRALDCLERGGTE
jgi:putative DNA-invertase from lambdoid prophage Rac